MPSIMLYNKNNTIGIIFWLSTPVFVIARVEEMNFIGERYSTHSIELKNGKMNKNRIVIKLKRRALLDALHHVDINKVNIWKKRVYIVIKGEL